MLSQRKVQNLKYKTKTFKNNKQQQILEKIELGKEDLKKHFMQIQKGSEDMNDTVNVDNDDDANNVDYDCAV